MVNVLDCHSIGRGEVQIWFEIFAPLVPLENSALMSNTDQVTIHSQKR